MRIITTIESDEEVEAEPEAVVEASNDEANSFALDNSGATDHLKTSQTFSDFHICRPLLTSLSKLNFIYPTPIQSATLPDSLSGKSLLCSAPTGSGKTLSFILPILERVISAKQQGFALKTDPSVLIVTPTRELAKQIWHIFDSLCCNFVSCGLLLGGVDFVPKNVDVILGTPGKLIDCVLNSNEFDLTFIEMLILDETDKLLSLGFSDQIEHLIEPIKSNKNLQILLFSATMDSTVKKWMKDIPHKTVEIDPSSLSSNLSQTFIQVKPEFRLPTLLYMLKKHSGKKMVFFQEKKACARVSAYLRALDLDHSVLHGDLSQPTRMKNLEKFSTTTTILLCTDVASRGVDIEDVRIVINFEMPYTLNGYIHRVGRTARAGKNGSAFTLYAKDESQRMKHNTKKKVLKEVIKRSKNIHKLRIPREKVDEWTKIVAEQKGNVKCILESDKAMNDVENLEKKMKREPTLEPEKKEWFQDKETMRFVKKLARVQKFGTSAEVKELKKKRKAHLEKQAEMGIQKKAKRERKKFIREPLNVDGIADSGKTAGYDRLTEEADMNALDKRNRKKAMPKFESNDKLMVKKKKGHNKFKSKSKFKRR